MTISKLFGLILFCFMGVVLQGQSFVGTILDKVTNQPIESADIFFLDLNAGTVSDQHGMFTIEHFTRNKMNIQISFVGYQSLNEVIDLESIKTKTFYLESSHYELDEVVVSVPSGKLQSDNVVNVDHKGLQVLQQTTPTSLAEALSNIPGVDQSSTGVGLGKPIIRGLSGNRIVTYAQGIRVENQQWGAEHGLGVGAVGIESVEVIKGPASLLYGSDALGGVLYFIDERYADHNTVEGFIGSGYQSNTIGSTTEAGLKIHKNEFKFNLFGAYGSNADYKVPDLGRVENTRFEEVNIKGAFGFNTLNWVTNIRYSYLKNNFGISEDGSYSKDKNRDFEVPFQKIGDQNLSFKNVYYLDNSKLDLTLGYTNNYRQEFEDDIDSHALGMRLKTHTYNLQWKSEIDQKLSFVLGSQGMFQKNKNDGEEVLIPDAETTDLGAFAVIHINLEKVDLQSGIRYDRRRINTRLTEVFQPFEEKYNGLTFSAGAVFQLEPIKWRVNISSGFRAPNTSELLSNGVHEGTNRYEIGNPNLVEERATQLDMSIEYEDEHLSIAFNPFYNSINDYIYIDPTDAVIGSYPVYEYLQTKAHLYGGELGVHYHPHNIHWLHIESAFSTVWAEDTDDNPLPLIPQANLNTLISADLSSKGYFQLQNFFVQHIYKFKQNRIGQFETNTDNYHLFNVGLTGKLGHGPHPAQIKAGIKNLFNNSYIDHLSRFKESGILNQGLNFYVDVKFNFGKAIGE